MYGKNYQRQMTFVFDFCYNLSITCKCDLMPFFLQGFQYRPSHPLQDGTQRYMHHQASWTFRLLKSTSPIPSHELYVSKMPAELNQ